jgi:hypothetical protein
MFPIIEPRRVVQHQSNRLLKNAHLRRSPHPSSLQRTAKYPSLLRISGAPASEAGFSAKLNLHLPACRSLGAGRGIFDQPLKYDFFSKLQTD